jgi:hypothetical protein
VALVVIRRPSGPDARPSLLKTRKRLPLAVEEGETHRRHDLNDVGKRELRDDAAVRCLDCGAPIWLYSTHDGGRVALEDAPGPYVIDGTKVHRTDGPGDSAATGSTASLFLAPLPAARSKTASSFGCDAVHDRYAYGLEAVRPVWTPSRVRAPTRLLSAQPVWSRRQRHSRAHERGGRFARASIARPALREGAHGPRDLRLSPTR